MATFAYNIVCQSRKVADVADLAQLVEQLIRNEQVVGSNPIISSIIIADLAQLVEQLIRNEQVVGSSPIASSIEKSRLPRISLGAFFMLGTPKRPLFVFWGIKRE